MVDHVLRIGIGGPVGSGKTALTEALVPILIAGGRSPGVITNDIYTQEDAQHVRRELAGILDPDRVVGVETGACPHTAVRDDPTMNLAAGEDMLERFPDIDTLIYESGGDNLTLTFSPALADVFVFVLDTSEGEKMPRKRGPGDHRQRHPGHQQDRHRPVRAHRPRRDGARRPRRARRTARRAHQLARRRRPAGAARPDPRPLVVTRRPRRMTTAALDPVPARAPRRPPPAAGALRARPRPGRGDPLRPRRRRPRRRPPGQGRRPRARLRGARRTGPCPAPSSCTTTRRRRCRSCGRCTSTRPDPTCRTRTC